MYDACRSNISPSNGSLIRLNRCFIRADAFSQISRSNVFFRVAVPTKRFLQPVSKPGQDNLLRQLLFHSLAECLRILRPKFFEVLWQLLDDVRDLTRIAMVSENCKDVSDGAFRGYGVWKMS